MFSAAILWDKLYTERNYNLWLILYYSYIYDILTVKTDLRLRLRKLPPISQEEEESRILMRKEWNRYKTQQHMATIRALDSIFYSQQRALDELRAESEDLYQEAIQVIINFTKRIKLTMIISCDIAVNNFESTAWFNSYICIFRWI